LGTSSRFHDHRHTHTQPRGGCHVLGSWAPHAAVASWQGAPCPCPRRVHTRAFRRRQRSHGGRRGWAAACCPSPSPWGIHGGPPCHCWCSESTTPITRTHSTLPSARGGSVPRHHRAAAPPRVAARVGCTRHPSARALRPVRPRSGAHHAPALRCSSLPPLSAPPTCSLDSASHPEAPDRR